MSLVCRIQGTALMAYRHFDGESFKVEEGLEIAEEYQTKVLQAPTTIGGLSQTNHKMSQWDCATFWRTCLSLARVTGEELAQDAMSSCGFLQHQFQAPRTCMKRCFAMIRCSGEPRSPEGSELQLWRLIEPYNTRQSCPLRHCSAL